MKSWHFWVSAAAAVVIGFLFFEDELARLVWQKYGNARAALALNRRDADLAIELGDYYFGGTAGRSGYDLGKAEQAYRLAVAVNPKILWGHYQLGRIYFVEGKYDRALEEINREFEVNPQNLRSLYVRGLIYGYRKGPGDLEKAARDFSRFIQWAPREWGGYNDLAWILSQLEKYAEAEEVIRTAFRKVPDAETNPWLWNSLGVVQLNIREYAGAKIAFKKAGVLAEKLTIGDWHKAYPGNDPKTYNTGLESFLDAINDNLRRAEFLEN